MILMTDKKTWSLRASAFEFLAFSLTYPSEVLANALVLGEWVEAAQEIAHLLELDLDEGWDQGLAAYQGEDRGEVLSRLRIEATRLFIGSPQPLVAPYEGVWRAHDKGVQALLFVNPFSVEVEKIIKEAGFSLPEGKNEPYDHITYELSFLQYLSMVESGMIESLIPMTQSNESVSDVYVRFRTEHTDAWFPRFAEKVIDESNEAVYRASASLLKVI